MSEEIAAADANIREIQRLRGLLAASAERERIAADALAYTRKDQSVNITQITVSYGETQSLPEYSNVKPSITLTATVGDGEMPEDVERSLWRHAIAAVHDQIDTALEANGKPAKYSTEPRYQIMRTYHDRYGNKGKPEPPKIVVILPNELELDRDSLDHRLVHAGYGESRMLRYAHAMRLAEKAAREYENAAVIDCADGDLSKLEAALAVETPVSNPDDAPMPESEF